jgi:hypothetical protein
MKQFNAITIDVEDYFQVSAFENTIDRNNWDNLEHRVSANIDQSLQVLSDHNVKATFLHWVGSQSVIQTSLLK